MLSRAATRATTSLVTKRGFHASRAQFSSPYHYPEGAYSNIPFNPRSKWFGPAYWTFMATGFFTPFGIAGAWFLLRVVHRVDSSTNLLCSLADLQAPVNSLLEYWVGLLSVDRAGSIGGGLLCTYPNRHQQSSILVHKNLICSTDRRLHIA